MITGLTFFMFIRGIGQMEGVAQLARGGIVTGNFKIAFIRRHMITGQLSVFIDDSAINDNKSHAIGRGHCHAAGSFWLFFTKSRSTFQIGLAHF